MCITADVVRTAHGQITVSPDGPVTSIQQAIEMSEPGGTIWVKPGTYTKTTSKSTNR
jgi:hypothetical protein